MNILLAIDPEFEGKCPPLTDEEFRQLRENILEEGLVLMPLIVWNNTIIDGHNRYRIATENPGIEFTTHEKVFDSRYEALAWICKNQLGRRNLTPMQKKYLIGQRYAAEKHLTFNLGNQYTLSRESGVGQNDPPQNDHGTRSRIAAETHTSDGYVKRADQYAKGVDAAEEALPGIKDDLLLGKIKPRESEVSAIAKAAPEERREMAEQLRTPHDNDTAAPPVTHNRRDLQQIKEYYNAMKNPNNQVDEESILETIQNTVRMMMRVCDTLFADFPRLLTDETYKSQVIEIMQEPKTYIQNIEGDQYAPTGNTIRDDAP